MNNKIRENLLKNILGTDTQPLQSVKLTKSLDYEFLIQLDPLDLKDKVIAFEGEGRTGEDLNTLTYLFQRFAQENPNLEENLKENKSEPFKVLGNIFLISNVLKLDHMILLTKVLSDQFFPFSSLGEVTELGLVGINRLDEVSNNFAENVNKKIENHFEQDGLVIKNNYESNLENTDSTHKKSMKAVKLLATAYHMLYSKTFLVSAGVASGLVIYSLYKYNLSLESIQHIKSILPIYHKPTTGLDESKYGLGLLTGIGGSMALQLIKRLLK
jgi:hypothetical protein